MERYYENWIRKEAHRNQKDHDMVITCEQLRDILALVRDGKYPDGSFSDNECIFYEVVKEVLGISF